MAMNRWRPFDMAVERWEPFRTPNDIQGEMNRLLDTIDAWAQTNDVDGEVDPPHRFAPTAVEESPPLALDLGSGAIKTVLCATGFRPDYSWLHVPVLDRKGRI